MSFTFKSNAYAIIAQNREKLTVQWSSWSSPMICLWRLHHIDRLHMFFMSNSGLDGCSDVRASISFHSHRKSEAIGERREFIIADSVCRQWMDQTIFRLLCSLTAVNAHCFRRCVTYKWILFCRMKCRQRCQVKSFHCQWVPVQIQWCIHPCEQWVNHMMEQSYGWYEWRLKCTLAVFDIYRGIPLKIFDFVVAGQME